MLMYKLSRTLTNATYFTLTQSVGLTFFGIIAGILMRFTHRYKVSILVHHPFSVNIITTYS